MLTLLLCLTVPVSGWASVLGGSLCPREQHAEQSDAAAPHQHSSDHAMAQAVHGPGHAIHCDGTADHGKPCKGEVCGCGCAFGACSSASLSLLAAMPFPLFVNRGTQAIPSGDLTAYADTRSSSLLRPPIS